MCYYCDFHFSVSLKRKDDLLNALHKEIQTRNFYLVNEEIETIYFGGGTPSLLSIIELDTILNLIYKHYLISKNPEITLEANPDDLSYSYLQDLQKIGVNRLSVGIQSFDDKKLKLLNRRHNAKEAINSVKNSQDAGFNNINIDLIYGLPDLTNQKWQDNLHIAFDLEIQHISSYHLTIEPKTAFHNFVKKGKLSLPEEKESLVQFQTLVKETGRHGFIHYEISNFAKEGFFSKHNTNYWLHKKYIGFGPSAHSYDFSSRQWNVANNAKYIENVIDDKSYFKKEILSVYDKYNDYILTSLRTMWGIDLNKIRKEFGQQYYNMCLHEAQIFIQSEQLILSNNKLILTKSGKFLADKIASDLFFIN